MKLYSQSVGPGSNTESRLVYEVGGYSTLSKMAEGIEHMVKKANGSKVLNSVCFFVQF